MKKISTILLLTALFTTFFVAARAQDVYEGKNPKTHKGPKRMHHNMDLPGDNHHSDMEYRHLPNESGKGHMKVNKGPRENFHGVRDRGHSHYYNRDENNDDVYDNTHRYRGVQRPVWAKAHQYDFNRHAYFPDYYVFYDARRNGYVFWENNRWNFSKDVPTALMDADLGKSRMVIMDDVKLKEDPSFYFKEFYKGYPPQYDLNLPLPPL